MKRKMYKFLNSLTLPLGGHVYHLQWYMHFIPGEPWLISLQGRISSAVAYALLLLFLLVLTGGWSKAVVVQHAERVLQKQLYCSLIPQIWTLAAMKMI